MVLPTVPGAMCWFAIKVAMTTRVAGHLLPDSSGRADGLFPPMFRSLVLLLSLRPILGDLHHGNNNLLILFLIVAMLAAWRRGIRRRGRPAPGAGDDLQGDAGAVLRLLRLQAVVADRDVGRCWAWASSC